SSSSGGERRPGRPTTTGFLSVAGSFASRAFGRTRGGAAPVARSGSGEDPLAPRLQRRRHGPMEHRVLTQDRNRDPWTERRDRVELHLEGRDEQVAAAPHAAAEDHDLGTEDR